MKVTTETIKKTLIDATASITDANGKTYELTERGWSLTDNHWRSNKMYIQVTNGDYVIRKKLEHIELIQMNCRTWVNPKNVVSSKIIQMEERVVIYLKTTKKNWWDTTETLEEITENVRLSETDYSPPDIPEHIITPAKTRFVPDLMTNITVSRAIAERAALIEIKNRVVEYIKWCENNKIGQDQYWFTEGLNKWENLQKEPTND